MTPSILKNLLSDFGQPLTLSKVSGGTFDPDTATESGSSTTTESFTGYFYEYDSTTVDNQNVIFGDRRLAMLPQNLDGEPITAPEEGDLILGEQDTVVVVKVEKILSKGVVVAIICQVRE